MESIADISAALEQIRKRECPKKEVLALIEKDLCSGLSVSDVEVYYKRKISVERMKLISKCLHAGVPKEKIAFMMQHKVEDDGLRAIYEYTVNGVPFAMIEPYVESNRSDRFIKMADSCSRYLSRDKDKKDVNPEQVEETDETVEEVVDEKVEEVAEPVQEHPDTDNKKTVEDDSKTVPEETDSPAQPVAQSALLPDDVIELLTGMQNMVKGISEQMEKHEQMLEAEKNNTVHMEDKIREEYIAKLEEKEKQLQAKDAEMEEQQNRIRELKRAELKVKEEYEKKIKELEDRAKVRSEEKADTNNEVKAKETEPVPDMPVQQIEEETKVAKSDIPVSYSRIMTDSSGQVVSAQPLEVMTRRRRGVMAVGSALVFKKKSQRDMVDRALAGELTVEQIAQIRHGMELNLREDQLCTIIKSRCDAKIMKEVVEMAALQNQMGYFV